MFFSEYSGVRPDIMVMAKGLANGFPLSAIVSRKEIMDKQKPGTMVRTCNCSHEKTLELTRHSVGRDVRWEPSFVRGGDCSDGGLRRGAYPRQRQCSVRGGRDGYPLLALII